MIKVTKGFSSTLVAVGALQPRTFELLNCLITLILASNYYLLYAIARYNDLALLLCVHSRCLDFADIQVLKLMYIIYFDSEIPSNSITEHLLFKNFLGGMPSD